MNKELFRLAVPNILSNLSVPLLGMVDTALMGHQSSVAYIGAITLAGVVFNFVYWSFGFLRMGTTGLTAQAFGDKNETTQITVLGRAIFTALIGALAVLLFQIPILELSFHLLEGSEEVKSIASEYFYIRIWAAPATLGLYAMMGWFFGMQNSWYPLIITFIVNGLNIIGNFIFVAGYGMGADGIAYATVIAQYVGFFTAIALFLYKYRFLLPKLKSALVFKVSELLAFFRLNKDIFIRTFLLLMAFAFFTDRSALMGDDLFAVNSVLLQFVFFMSYGIDGFAFASESLVGKYKGGSEPKLLKKSIELSFFWGGVTAVFYMVFFLLFGEWMLDWFTDKKVVIDLSKEYLTWVILFPIAGFVCYIWDGVFIGLTSSRSMVMTMLVSFVFYMAIYFLWFESMGNHGLWAAFTLFMMARGLTQSIWYWKGWVDK